MVHSEGAPHRKKGRVVPEASSIRARSTRLAGSVRERVIETSLARSSSPIDNAITRRHAVMTFDSVPRIKSHRTSHHNADESLPYDRVHGIDELAYERQRGKIE